MIRIGLVLSVAGVVMSAVASAPATSAGRSEASAFSEAVSAPGIGAVRATDGDRIIWDDSLDDIRIVSARPDGSDRTVIYQRSAQDAYNLALSPDGKLVAFSPFDTQGPRTRLVVSSVSSPRPQNILPAHSGAIGIGAIGWSRDGRRLYFMSFVDEPGTNVHARLFSISRSGKDLRKGRPVNATAVGVASGEIVETRRGIVYKDGTTIRRFASIKSGATSRVIARHAYDLRVSRDGRWLFYRRVTPGGRQSLQRISSAGRSPSTVLRYRDDGLDVFLAYAPDTTGARIVGTRQAADNSYRTWIIDTRTLHAEEVPVGRATLSIAW